MRNEDEDQDQETGGGPSPEMLGPKIELLLNGVVIFMGDVTVESMSPLIDWILAENFKPKPDKIIPPIIIPKLPIAAPAAALLWAPLIRPTKTSLGPIAVSLFLHDKTKVETIPQKAP